MCLILSNFEKKSQVTEVKGGWWVRNVKFGADLFWYWFYVLTTYSHLELPEAILDFSYFWWENSQNFSFSKIWIFFDLKDQISFPIYIQDLEEWTNGKRKEKQIHHSLDKLSVISWHYLAKLAIVNRFCRVGRLDFFFMLSNICARFLFAFANVTWKRKKGGDPFAKNRLVCLPVC